MGSIAASILSTMRLPAGGATKNRTTTIGWKARELPYMRRIVLHRPNIAPRLISPCCRMAPIVLPWVLRNSGTGLQMHNDKSLLRYSIRGPPVFPWTLRILIARLMTRELLAAQARALRHKQI